MMLRNIVLGVFLAAAFYGLAVYIGLSMNSDVGHLIDAYQKNMRGYLFSAFLGISSFLLSLLTFVVINLKEKMFDSDDYLKIYAERKDISSGDDIIKAELYAPLVTITTVLVISILCSIASAIFQFTLGFSANKYVLIFPTIMPFVASSFMILSLYQMTQLIYQWLRSKESIKAP